MDDLIENDIDRTARAYEEAIELLRDSWFVKAKIHSVFKFISDTAGQTMVEKGAIGGRTVEKCFSKADALVTRTIRPLMSRYYRRPIGNGLYSHEACHVVNLGRHMESSLREHISQLFSIRILLTNDLIETEFLPLPLGFRMHAVARIIERAEDVPSAARQIGLDLVESSNLIRLAEHSSGDALSNHMVLPAFGKGGLLVGSYRHDTALVEGSISRITRDGREVSRISRSPLEGAFFEAKTYFGEEFSLDVLGRQRDVLRHEMVEWRKRNSAVYEQEMASLLWPGRKLAKSAPLDLISDHSAELDEILNNPYMALTTSRSHTDKRQAMAKIRQQSISEIQPCHRPL